MIFLLNSDNLEREIVLRFIAINTQINHKGQILTKASSKSLLVSSYLRVALFFHVLSHAARSLLLFVQSQIFNHSSTPTQRPLARRLLIVF